MLGNACAMGRLAAKVSLHNSRLIFRLAIIVLGRLSSRGRAGWYFYNGIVSSRTECSPKTGLGK